MAPHATPADERSIPDELVEIAARAVRRLVVSRPRAVAVAVAGVILGLLAGRSGVLFGWLVVAVAVVAAVYVGWRYDARTARVARLRRDFHRFWAAAGWSTPYPRMLGLALSPSGEVATLMIPPGKSVSDFAAMADALGHHLSVPVAIRQSSRLGRVEIELRERDPFAELTTGSRTVAVVGRASDQPAASGAHIETIFGHDEWRNALRYDWREPYHCAIQGRTRAGKTAFVAGSLIGLAGDERVVVAGSDLHSSLLSPFVRPGRGASYPGIALGMDDPAAHAQVISLTVTEMRRRLDLIAADRYLDKLPAPTAELPLIVLVLEEFPALLDWLRRDDDASGRRTGSGLREQVFRDYTALLAQSAKANIRLVVLTSRGDVEVLGGPQRGNLALHVSLAVDRAGVEMLHGDADEALKSAVPRFLPGQALVSWPGQPPVIVRAPHIPYHVYVAHVDGCFPAARKPWLPPSGWGVSS